MPRNAKNSLLNSLPISPISHTFCDFDRVMYSLNAEEAREHPKTITVSISISAPCFEQLNGLFSIVEEMKTFYPEAKAISIDPTTPSLVITFMLDLYANHVECIERISLLKRNLFSIPFYHAISIQESNCQNTQKAVMFAYRPDECVFIKPYSDRIVVIFQLKFKSNDDTIFAKVFIQVDHNDDGGYFLGICRCQKATPVAKLTPGNLFQIGTL